jgi:hypothetical protein
MASDHNMFLINGCQNIQNLTVSFEITEDLVQVVTGAETPGFTVQLNALTPRGSPTTWMQYVFEVMYGTIVGNVEYWNNNTLVFNSNTQVPIPSTVSLPVNTLPQNWTLELGLNTDPATGNVNQANFTVKDATTSPAIIWTAPPIPIPSASQFPMVAFQLNVVGPGGGAYASFQSGGQGTITYSADGGLCIEGGGTDKCSGRYTFTQETSNAAYGPISPCCASSGLPITQSLTT